MFIHCYIAYNFAELMLMQSPVYGNTKKAIDFIN